nr:hypothetical protein HmN_000251000 [Hymenolepis microstoma]
MECNWKGRDKLNVTKASLPWNFDTSISRSNSSLLYTSSSAGQPSRGAIERGENQTEQYLESTAEGEAKFPISTFRDIFSPPTWPISNNTMEKSPSCLPFQQLFTSKQTSLRISTRGVPNILLSQSFPTASGKFLEIVC